MPYLLILAGSSNLLFSRLTGKQKTRISTMESGQMVQRAHFPFLRSYCELAEMMFPGFPSWKGRGLQWRDRSGL